ncbi:MAG: hypothetical protein LBS72_06845 [Oscillospiraceae bacterium]|nr:hypothetical protein [Oscillospiraceae bacterium]
MKEFFESLRSGYSSHPTGMHYSELGHISDFNSFEYEEYKRKINESCWKAFFERPVFWAVLFGLFFLFLAAFGIGIYMFIAP